jgi:nucleotide-binding universal stress UspA family protein
MSKIIVGVDQSEGSNDAIALASGLAGIAGAELMLVNVFPFDTTPSRAINAGFEAYLRKDSHELLERLRTELGDDAVEIKAVANPSPAHGLHEVAVPGRRGAQGLPPAPGSGARDHRLRLRRLPVSAARARGGSPHRGGHRGEAAGHPRFQPLAYDIPPGGSIYLGGVGSYNDSLQDRASDELNAAVAKLDGEPRAEAFFAVGDAGKILVEQSEQLDLLLVGSRGYGPLHSVLIGGVAGRVVREAACPVIALPRKARHVGEDSLFAEAARVTG